MLIEKEFSNVDREEERVFSVFMDEEELRLYSEFLEEREYGNKANKDAKKAWELNEARKLNTDIRGFRSNNSPAKDFYDSTVTKHIVADINEGMARAGWAEDRLHQAGNGSRSMLKKYKPFRFSGGGIELTDAEKIPANLRRKGVLYPFYSKNK